MKNLLENIDEQIAAFQKDAKLFNEKGNKAAGQRARKASLAIASMLKDFRKQSVQKE